MPKLASKRLAKQLQRETGVLFYGDKGILLQDTVSSLDEYGQPNVTTTSVYLDCAFTDMPDKEKWQDYADVEQISAEVRFVSAAIPARGNRFTVTTRFSDSNYTNTTFEIIGIQNRGTFGYMCALKKVQI